MKKEVIQKLLAWDRSYRQRPDILSIVPLFQDLIDTGDLQDMDPFYHELANTLLELGLCHRPELRIVK